MVHPPQMLMVDFHQLQMCKLLQYKDLVVCPEGLNGQMEASQFTFNKELPPLGCCCIPSKPACKPQLMVGDLGSMHPEGVTATIQTPHSTPVLPSPPADALLNLLVTPLQQSTCSLWVPWSDCSRLPPSSQLPSPGTACHGNSHHLQL